MIEIDFLRAPMHFDCVDARSRGAAERPLDFPYIVAGAGPMASDSRELVAVWANEGGAGGEVRR
jgi:hypothetical protein